MEDQEIPMSEGHRVRQVLGAGGQPKRDAFHGRLAARLFFIWPIPTRRIPQIKKSYGPKVRVQE
jgi:hypothetical protein